MITSNLKEGTAYLKIVDGRKSDSTLPIDDAFIFVDRSDGRVAGFEFDVNAKNKDDWMSAWQEYKPDLFQSFLKMLTAQPGIDLQGHSFIIKSAQKVNLERISGAAYVDVDEDGEIIGVEFLFKGV